MKALLSAPGESGRIADIGMVDDSLVCEAQISLSTMANRRKPQLLCYLTYSSLSPRFDLLLYVTTLHRIPKSDSMFQHIKTGFQKGLTVVGRW